MNQLELNETEIIALAQKQLVSQGKIPKGAMVYPARSTDPDAEGQYTFQYRWRELDPK